MTRRLAVGLLLGSLLAACVAEAPPGAAANTTMPDNPLPSCPSWPNCVRETRLFDVPPDVLFSAAQAALAAVGAAAVNTTPEALRLDAVFPVAFLKDDVALLIERREGRTALHIRSASRVGAYDFGVNRRRIRAFFDALAKSLTPQAART